jgi:hypothetical protein
VTLLVCVSFEEPATAFDETLVTSDSQMDAVASALAAGLHCKQTHHLDNEFASCALVNDAFVLQYCLSSELPEPTRAG